jgi:hypothetical protein
MSLPSESEGNQPAKQKTPANHLNRDALTGVFFPQPSSNPLNQNLSPHPPQTLLN